MKVNWPDLVRLLAIIVGALVGAWWSRMQRRSERARQLTAAWASLEAHAAAVVQAVKQVEPADARDASGKLKQGAAAHLLDTALSWLGARAAPELAVLRSHGIDVGATLRTLVETAVADAKSSAPTDWGAIVMQAVNLVMPSLSLPAPPTVAGVVAPPPLPTAPAAAPAPQGGA